MSAGDVLPGSPPPLALVEAALVHRQQFAALEVQSQLLYALVDQVCSLSACGLSCLVSVDSFVTVFFHGYFTVCIRTRHDS